MSTQVNEVWTAESVSEGHPDKVADAISDAIVDEFLKRDPYIRVAAETFVPSAHMAILGGEVGIPQDSAVRIEDINYVALVRQVANRIGYTDVPSGFDGQQCVVQCSLKSQSANIARGVLQEQQGAGDQGMMFGYACVETPELMPAPITYAHHLAATLAKVRHMGVVPHLRPDGKTQVTIQYRDMLPERVVRVVLAAQHDPFWNDKQAELQEVLRHAVVEKVIPAPLLEGFDWAKKYTLNGTGIFEIGGPLGDTGLTGRKIIVDTYGGMAPHGGGAFSGKDPSKVDRSANYYARYVAKNVVAAGLAQRCLIRVAYAIGKAEPIGLDVETFGTGSISQEKLLRLVQELFDFRPAAMIEQLKLRRPVYSPLAAYGHFGRTELPGATWELRDRADDLRRAAL